MEEIRFKRGEVEYGEGEEHTAQDPAGGGLSHNWIYSAEARRRTKQLSFGLFQFQTRHGPRNGKDQSV